MPSTYADKGIEDPKWINMTKKPKKELITARVRLYRASSQSPLRISRSAKTAIGKMKKVVRASDRQFLRVDASFETIMKEPALDIYFDESLYKDDMVYLSNKMLFVMDQTSALRLTGGTLECDSVGFYIDSDFLDDEGFFREKEVPKC